MVLTDSHLQERLEAMIMFASTNRHDDEQTDFLGSVGRASLQQDTSSLNTFPFY